MGAHSTDRDALTLTSSAEIRPLIELNDKLNALTKHERHIPSVRIIVVGDQSHGKSSLAENLCGIRLPRGDDMKTKLPLQLQLRDIDTSQEEYAEISLDGDPVPERLNIADITEKIDEYTERVVGSEKIIAEKEINLRVYRHNQDDLTIVDLPGVTRNAPGSEDPEAGERLERRICNLYDRYMAQEEVVIVNVVNANVDFSTSKSLQLSRQKDPKGKRTFVVMTKVDEYAKPDLVQKIFRESNSLNIDPERLFAVVNCSDQADQRSRASIEADAFACHEGLNRGSPECRGFGLGIMELSQSLVQVQKERILATLPIIAKTLQANSLEVHKEILKLGHIITDPMECRLMITSKIDELCEYLKRLHSGKTLRVAGIDEIHVGAEYRLGGGLDRAGEADTIVTASGGPGVLSASLNETDSRGTYDAKIAFSIPPNITGIHLQFEVILLRCASGEEEEEVTVASTGLKDHRFSHDCNETKLQVEMADPEEAELPTGFFCSFYVRSIESSEPCEDEDYLCAQLQEIGRQFSKKMVHLFPVSHFYSNSFQLELEMEAKRRGSPGLPGDVEPQLAVGALLKRHKYFPPLLKQYLKETTNATLNTIQKAVAKIVDADKYPKLSVFLKDAASSVVAEQVTEAERMQKKILLMEQEVVAHDGRYTKILERQRAKRLVDGSVFAPFLPFSSFSSNEATGILDMQNKCYAFWYHSVRRLVDTVVASAQHELTTSVICGTSETAPLLKTFLWKATQEIDPTELLAPCSKVCKKKADLLKRKKNFEEGLQLLKKEGYLLSTGSFFGS